MVARLFWRTRFVRVGAVNAVDEFGGVWHCASIVKRRTQITLDPEHQHRACQKAHAQLQKLAREAEIDLIQKYALRIPIPQHLSLYRRARRFVGRILRRLGFLIEPWSPRLRHFECSDGAKTVLIWALGADRETLRTACSGYATYLRDRPDRIPVLVTDVADFAFFSRLGWLVEYVPALSAPAGSYAERKRRYLAWRYRDALVLPVAVGLEHAAVRFGGGSGRV